MYVYYYNTNMKIYMQRKNKIFNRVYLNKLII